MLTVPKTASIEMSPEIPLSPAPGSEPSSPMMIPTAIVEEIPSAPEQTEMSVAPTPRETKDSADRNRLFIIGAGLSRTGTETMTAAMEILLGGRSYHGGTAVVVGGIVKEGALWKRAEGIPDFEKIFDCREDGIEYNATFDLPGNFHVQQMMERYPNYRVVLTKRRSAEEWADSVLNTIVPMAGQLRFLDKMSCRKAGPIHRAMEFVDEYSLVKSLGVSTDAATREQLVQVYNMHLAYIRKIVPADRLIEFEAGDSWEPLCTGLNLPIPSVPFPRKNERSGFKWRTGLASCKTFSKNHWPQVLCVVVMLVFFWTMLLMQISRLSMSESSD